MLSQFPDLVTQIHNVAAMDGFREEDLAISEESDIDGMRFWLRCLEYKLRLPTETIATFKKLLESKPTGNLCFALHNLLSESGFVCDFYPDDNSIVVIFPDRTPATLRITEFKGVRKVAVSCLGVIDGTYLINSNWTAKLFVDLSKLNYGTP